MTSSEKYRKNKKQILLRFTEEEYDKALSLSEKSGKTIQLLLKKSLFQNIHPKNIKLETNRNELLKKINLNVSRLGNNINQIARAVNTFEYVDKNDLSVVAAELPVLREMLEGAICHTSK